MTTDVFHLRDLGGSRFEGGAPGGPSTLFGGHVLAQGLLAAERHEGQGRLAHSLHAGFLAAGSSSLPTTYEVESVFEGRSFATRRVTAFQGDRLILTLNVSFHRPEEGASHRVGPQPHIAPAEAIERLDAWRISRIERDLADPVEHLDGRAIRIIPIEPEVVFGPCLHAPQTASWVRSRAPLPNDPAIHRAALAYASDLLLLRVSMLPHGFRPGMPGVRSASLDHALWMFDTPDLNDWVLFETESSWAGSGRSLNRGRFFDQHGNLIGEVMQESLIRMPRYTG